MNTTLGDFICGWGSAIVNVSITFPINKVMFRQQLHGISILEASVQLKDEGYKYLYRGLLPPLLQKSLSLSLMFGFYEALFLKMNTLKPNWRKEYKQAASAMGAGCIEAVLTPLERIQTLLQDKAYHNRFKNSIQTTVVIYRENGWKEFYRGLVPILLRNGPSNAVFFIARDHLSANLPSPVSQSREIFNDFLCGAFLGAITGTIFFPINVIKTRMQSKLGSEFYGTWKTFKIVLKERRFMITKLYKGVHVNALRSLISWGIINASYEFFRQFI